MQCTSPRTVGFKEDGKTISWSPRTHNKQYATFQLPCGKCTSCRLIYAREWAIRCMHESKMYEGNSFVTLTYSDENLKSPKLDYCDFQKFMKRLRFANPNRTIGCFVTGEYGDKEKRPHWHAILFNWTPSDAVEKYKNHRGDQVWESATLTKTWSKGIAEFGSVTIESAGYCARYAAKKLVHGHDGEHPFDPISKKSSKHAIGKKWLEKFWPDVFTNGYVSHINSRGAEEKLAVPRYYERWLKQNHPDSWLTYVTNAKLKKIRRANARSEKEETDWQKANINRVNFIYRTPSPNERRALVLQHNFKRLQQFLKL